MFRSWPRSVKLALERKVFSSSTTTHLAWRLEYGGPGDERALVVVEPRKRRSERPSVRYEARKLVACVRDRRRRLRDLRDVDEEGRLDAALGHAAVERCEDISGMAEAVAGEEDAFARSLEERPENDGRVAGGGAHRLGPGPDELGRWLRGGGTFSERRIEDSQRRGTRVARERGDHGAELRAEAERDEIRLGERRREAPIDDRLAHPFERRRRDRHEIRADARGHGLSPKNASSRGLPMVGTTSARSR